MTDLISRRDAMAYPLSWDHYDKEHGNRHFIAWIESYREYIEDLPSAEPEIVRCKDCEHWDTTWQNDWAKNYHYCPIVDGTRDGDWYCADAERRTDDEC